MANQGVGSGPGRGGRAPDAGPGWGEPACSCWLAPRRRNRRRTEAAAQAEARITAPHNGRCILIDSDGDLDDYRAVAMLGLTGRIVAIVMTEGISRPVQGAGAMEKVLRRVQSILPTHPVIPVIPGASGNPASRGPLRAGFRQVAGQCGAAERAASRAGRGLPAAARRPRRGAAAACEGLRPHLPAGDRALDLLPALRGGGAGAGRPDRRPGPPLSGRGRRPAGRAELHLRPRRLPHRLRPAGRAAGCGRAGRLRTEWVDIPNGLQSCGTAEPGVDDMGQRLYACRPTAGLGGCPGAGQGPGPGGRGDAAEEPRRLGCGPRSGTTSPRSITAAARCLRASAAGIWSPASGPTSSAAC